MKVIVKKSGWYGGDYFDESETEQEMADVVAAQFLPPHGDQLEPVRIHPPIKKTDTKMPEKVG